MRREPNDLGKGKETYISLCMFIYFEQCTVCIIIYSIILNKHLQKPFLFKAVKGGKAVIIMAITTNVNLYMT